MSLREIAFAALAAVAGSLIVTGVADLSAAAGWISGGVLLAVWSWLVLGDT